MKKLFLVAALATMTVSANAAPDIYGRIWMDIGYFEDGDAELNGNARVGFKGDTPLPTSYASDLEAIYKVEFEYNANPDDQMNNVKQRDIYLGLKSDRLGQLRAGRLGSADDAFTISANISDFAHSGYEGAWTGARWSDAIDYQTPKMNGLSAGITYKIADGKAEKITTYTDSTGATFDIKQGTEVKNDSDSFGLGLHYAPEGMPFEASISYADIKGNKVDNAINVAGKYNVNDKLGLKAAYNTTAYTDSNLKDTDNIAISAGYLYTPKMTTYIEYDHTTDLNGVSGADRDVVSTGIWYENTKQVSTYAAIGYVDKDSDDDGFGINTGMYFTF